jgi:hypothetical protein
MTDYIVCRTKLGRRVHIRESGPLRQWSMTLCGCVASGDYNDPVERWADAYDGDECGQCLVRYRKREKADA